MSAFERIIKAKTLLGLGERATLQEVKIRYKTLMAQWHPDKHPNQQEQAHEMSVMINESYAIILEYINHYEYAFDESYLKAHTLTPQEWWNERFSPQDKPKK